jgi:hypothetical protein
MTRHCALVKGRGSLSMCLFHANHALRHYAANNLIQILSGSACFQLSLFERRAKRDTDKPPGPEDDAHGTKRRPTFLRSLVQLINAKLSKIISLFLIGPK